MARVARKPNKRTTLAASRATHPYVPRGGKTAAHDLRVDGYLHIGDYGTIGDCRSLALVGVDGSIDWCCLPRFDSPSVFGRILDARKGGFWQVAPVGEYATRQEYIDKSNILRTIFQTPEGLALLVDYMPADEHDIMRHARPHRHPRIVRMITGLSGRVRMRQKIDLRPDYARKPNPLKVEGDLYHGDSENLHFCFSGTVPVTGPAQDFTLHPGQTIAFAMSCNHAGQCGRPMNDIESSRALFKETQQFWWHWIDQCTYTGPYQTIVWRSALALKLLTYAPTGAIVAAPTTSLPEWIGAERNWDYRFTWIRDASFTLYGLFQLGFKKEAIDFMEWVTKLTIKRGLNIMYTLDGKPPGEELELPHLEGYRKSRPVRTGNGAATQLQLDIYGELMDTVFIYVINGGQVSERLWRELQQVVEFAIERWTEPDAGLWEVRGQNVHFTYSKAMCWAAVDRGIRLAEMTKLPADLLRWRKARAQIHRAVMAQGFSKRLQAFTQAFGSDDLDASVLRLVQLGFLRNGDPRLRNTIDVVDAGLSIGPLMFRYRAEDTDDGFNSPEGSFIICAFWIADALAIVGDLEEAERRFTRLLAFASATGLFSEEVDPGSGALLGNYPQAFSHLALISAAVNIERRRSGTLVRNTGGKSARRRRRQRGAAKD
ncbi:MAG: glycoside hydrolase family 15 protein [Candidatus Dormiibacterota bacterium]